MDTKVLSEASASHLKQLNLVQQGESSYPIGVNGPLCARSAGELAW